MGTRIKDLVMLVLAFLFYYPIWLDKGLLVYLTKVFFGVMAFKLLDDIERMIKQ